VRALLLVIAGAMLLAACGGSGTPTAISSAGSESKRVAGVWWLAFGVGAAVYLIVAGLVVYGALRRGGAEIDEDRRRRERLVIVIGGVLVPFLILLFFAAVTVNATAHLRKAAPSNAVQLVVHGERWWWQVQYPALGIDTANEIHVPVGQPVHIELISDNVIHSFWVPQLAGKEDLVPGQPNELTFTVNEPGRYRGECAEYCGVEHARMGFYVIAQPASDFTTWVAQRQQLSTMPTSDKTAAGERVFVREACAGCHTIKGTPATGTIGPDLTDVGQRTTIAAATLANTPENMSRWIRDPQGVKPGNLMPPVHLNDADLSAVVAYLESLK
jgi:cytochrome c oxidase subunit 2